MVLLLKYTPYQVPTKLRISQPLTRVCIPCCGFLQWKSSTEGCCIIDTTKNKKSFERLRLFSTRVVGTRDGRQMYSSSNDHASVLVSESAVPRVNCRNPFLTTATSGLRTDRLELLVRTAVVG